MCLSSPPPLMKNSMRRATLSPAWVMQAIACTARNNGLHALGPRYARPRQLRVRFMAKLVHSMIRVIDETRSLDFYRRAFGLQIVDRIEFPEFALIYLNHPTSGSCELELTVNF